MLLICDSDAVSLRLLLATFPGSPPSLGKCHRENDLMWRGYDCAASIRKPRARQGVLTLRKGRFLNVSVITHMPFLCVLHPHIKTGACFPCPWSKYRMQFSSQLSNYSTVCPKHSWSSSTHKRKPTHARCHLGAVSMFMSLGLSLNKSLSFEVLLIAGKPRLSGT